MRLDSAQTYVFEEYFADPVVWHRYPEGVQEGLLKPPDFLQIREHNVDALRREDVLALAQRFDVAVEVGRNYLLKFYQPNVIK